MNFTKIAEMQKTLDESYSKNGFFNNQYIEQKRLVAILVEIGEFANEYAPFKYWKQNKNINRKKVVEEFIDGIHFFSTFINKLKIDPKNIQANIKSEDMSLQLLYTFKAVLNTFENINKKNMLEAFEVFLGNAKLLNISFQEIENAYIEKNKINFNRIKNGY